ncbi:DUF5072 family protein [Nosocomiicoccus sp. HMSC059G07]|uniref:DUF5072 family protein n=1 Tax=Nosocomiicoccus sp. HMSC059G07 TaxID=1739531 RepID=UPI0008A37271|nr:DUF5072 family protein [Nosocomiicoccus sp. HMSC059G07]OFO55662.1 hypothetical protein HMPREF3029_03555 [Nosocomiicoccus sp. HMSC059G07]
MRKLSIVEIQKLIKEVIDAHTNIKFVDGVERDQQAPFCFVEVSNSVPQNSKTMFVTIYNLSIHLVSKTALSSIEHGKNIQQIEEALTYRLVLPGTFEAFNQTDTSIMANYQNPKTGERHAVIGLALSVSYGFKSKI